MHGARGLAHAKNMERGKTNNQETSQRAVLPLCKALAKSTRNCLHPSTERELSKQDAPKPNSFTHSLIAREHCE